MIDEPDTSEKNFMKQRTVNKMNPIVTFYLTIIKSKENHIPGKYNENGQINDDYDDDDNDDADENFYLETVPVS